MWPDPLTTPVFICLLVVPSGSASTTEQLQPPNLPHQFGSPFFPVAKQPTMDVLRSEHCLGHTIQTFGFQQRHQTPVLQYASYLESVYTRKKLPIYDK